MFPNNLVRCRMTGKVELNGKSRTSAWSNLEPESGVLSCGEPHHAADKPVCRRG